MSDNTYTYRQEKGGGGGYLLADGGFGVLHHAHHLEEVAVAGLQGGGGVRDTDGIQPSAELLRIGHSGLDSEGERQTLGDRSGGVEGCGIRVTDPSFPLPTRKGRRVREEGMPLPPPHHTLFARRRREHAQHSFIPLPC
jgi:hypothetical protein